MVEPLRLFSFFFFPLSCCRASPDYSILGFPPRAVLWLQACTAKWCVVVCAVCSWRAPLFTVCLQALVPTAAC